MNTALEPALRAGQDDVLHALVSIIATTRRHWNLPPGPEASFGAGIAPESFSSRPCRRTAGSPGGCGPRGDRPRG